MAIKEGELTPRPYARLLTMLSDQLIKNNTIALTELIKNSYDADASWVQIRIGNMKNFGKKKLKEDEEPFVEIEDDGDGMAFSIIENSWMNPASLYKFEKRENNDSKTRKNRIIQGEKGIGRFAVYQIGKKVELLTRERIDENIGGDEIQLSTDLSIFTKELVSQKTITDFENPDFSNPLYLEDIKSKFCIEDEPTRILPGKIIIEGEEKERKNHGTIIRITELNYEWKENGAKKIRRIISKLQSPFRKQDFAVSILFDGKEIALFEKFKLSDILSEALLSISGSVDNEGKCTYTLEGANTESGNIDLVDNLKKEDYRLNREHFFDEKLNRIHEPESGPFDFQFYVYDIENISDKELRNYIRSHRTYIYRDDIRIYPYGDQDNDWIKLDILRGLVKAGWYLSNDQLIGYVSITSEGNPKLRDKTNREGLVEVGTSHDDLRLLTLSIINYLHAQYLVARIRPKAKRRKKRVNKLYLQAEKVETQLDVVNKHLKDKDDLDGQKKFDKLTEDYYEERKVSREQIETVEDLAGVGIAVDAASHDVMVMMDRSMERINEIDKLLKVKAAIDKERLIEKTESLKGQFIVTQDLLKGIQPLFRSARRKRKMLRIQEIIETVTKYYDTPLQEHHIDVEIIEHGSPLEVSSSEGILLQLFINLMDNSVYWLRMNKSNDPKIKVIINGEKGYAIFADNGPGVQKKYYDYIFEPFFSLKGLHGRGLGLYIARQLTDKYEYDLYYLEDKKDCILPGANFKIDFIEQEEE